MTTLQLSSSKDLVLRHGIGPAGRVHSICCPSETVSRSRNSSVAKFRDEPIAIPESRQLIISLFKMPAAALRSPQAPILLAPRALSRGKSGQRVRMTTHIHRVESLRMRGAIPPSLPHVIMGRMGTTSRDNVSANVRWQVSKQPTWSK